MELKGLNADKRPRSLLFLFFDNFFVALLRFYLSNCPDAILPKFPFAADLRAMTRGKSDV